MLTIHSLMGNTQALDGGAMFGNAPRALWSRWCVPDEQGRIPLASRCFLVNDGSRTILIEAGIGAFFSPEMRERYGVRESEHRLLESLRAVGVAADDIDVVLLSHLHFDHAGGILQAFTAGNELSLAFGRAQFVVSDVAYQRAQNPHPRDRASYVDGLPELLRSTGRLHLVSDSEPSHPALGPRIHLSHSHGHTPGMLVPTLLGDAQHATFCADLIPGAAWVHLPITMGYDRFPELVVDEKRSLYERFGEGLLLLFTHDFELAAGVLERDERGRYRVGQGKAALAALDLDAVA